MNNKQIAKDIANEVLNQDARYTPPKFDLVDEDVFDKITAYHIKAKTIMEENPIYKLTDDENDNVYRELSQIWREASKYVETMPIKFTMIGSQAKEFARLIKNADYTAETLFWGIRINEEIIDKIDKTKYTNTDEQVFETNLMTLVMAHTIVSSSPFKGITYEGYLMAKLLVDITEFVKIYNSISNQVNKISESISKWESADVPLADVDIMRVETDK